MTSYFTQAAIRCWVPGQPNRELWEALTGKDGLSGYQVADVMADVLTYIMSELGPMELAPGSHTEAEWRSQISDNIGKAVLQMIHCWQECDDPRPHLTENVRMVTTVDLIHGSDITERLLYCLFDLAASLRDGTARLVSLDNEGVRVIR